MAPGDFYPFRRLEYRVKYYSAQDRADKGEESGLVYPIELDADPAPIEQGPLVFEIPAADYALLDITIISDWAGYRRSYIYRQPLPGDEDSYYSVVMYFPGPGIEHRSDGKYAFRDIHTPDPCATSPTCMPGVSTRVFDDAKSMMEAALATLPNVASAEVTFLADKWRIELTPGPGGIEILYPSARGSDDDPFPLPVRLARGEHKHYYYPIEQSGAAQLFTFDAVTSGALPPSATAAIDMGIAEGDGATDPLLADPPAAWQMGIDGGFDGNLQLDYIGA